MNDYFAEPPASRMSDDAFSRRREHLRAELERSPARRLGPAAAGALVTVTLTVLVFAPISGASLGHRLVTGLGDMWSSPAPPTKYSADVQNMAGSATNEPPGVTYRGGAALTGEARDLLSGLGTADDTISAYPTSSGAVCYMIKGAGSCANLETWPWNTVGFTYSVFSTRADGVRVFGIASDNVASISVVVGGVSNSAILHNNAFYYQLPQGTGDSDIERIVATWNDGSIHTVPVSTHWYPSSAPSASSSSRPGASIGHGGNAHRAKGSG